MFLVTDINGMTNFVAVSTDLFITTKLWASVILVRKTIFLKTDTLSVTQLSTKSTGNGIGTGVVNKGNRGNIFYISYKNTVIKLAFLLDNKRKNFGNSRDRFHEQNMSFYIVVLVIKAA